MHRIVSLGALGLVAGTLVACGASANGQSNDIGSEGEALRNASESSGGDGRAVPVRVRPGPANPDPAPIMTGSSVVPNGGPVTPPPASIAEVTYSDLVLGYEMDFFEAGDDEHIGVEIDVTNVGTSAATALTGLVSVGHAPCSQATLYPYGTSTNPHTVNPGEKGYILTYVPRDTLAVCNSYQVSIDIRHDMQFEQHHTGVFTNDTGEVRTPCLAWETPITLRELGHEPDSHLQNRNIEEIVGSYTSVLDGPVCSDCHYANSTPPYPIPLTDHWYSPPVGKGQSSVINPTDLIGGKVWTGTNGWASEFVKHPEIKRVYMMDLLATWASNGWK